LPHLVREIAEQNAFLLSLSVIDFGGSLLNVAKLVTNVEISGTDSGVTIYLEPYSLFQVGQMKMLSGAVP
jgi:hypothetical protein